MFGYVIASPINMLEVVPLFFLGSTLIFIGYVFNFTIYWIQMKNAAEL
jgi:hypothetical protein